MGKQICEYLSEPYEIEVRGERRELRASDIAILTEKNNQAEDVNAYLSSLRIPVVMARNVSIWSTPEAKTFLLFLRVLADSRNKRHLKSLLLTNFFQYTLAELIEGEDLPTGLAVEDGKVEDHGRKSTIPFICKKNGLPARDRRDNLLPSASSYSRVGRERSPTLSIWQKSFRRNRALPPCPFMR